MVTRIAILVAATMLAASAAEEPSELVQARQKFQARKNPSDADRVRYITRLVRLRESLTRADAKLMFMIDAEIVRHPMPRTADARMLAKRLIGRWQSPRHPYFYHAGGTWASDDDTSQGTGGTWRIEGNQFFQNYRVKPPSYGETIILLTDTDFVYGSAPYYLRRGTAFPWH
jgi:hypothetical protein